jgi:phosphoglycerol transferase MdoB-like AlkP superfamily enzyme
MSILKRLPGLTRFLLAAVALDFVVFALFRFAFWAEFRETMANADWADLLRALYLGLKFDLRLALLIGLPIGLAGWFGLFNPARRREARIVWMTYLAVAQCVVLLLYFVDFGHYAYVGVRLNASVIDHLTPVGIAARVAWDTYPIVWCVLALGLLTYAYVWLLGRIARRTLTPAEQPFGRWTTRAAVGALAVLYGLGIFGKWSAYPLRWSEAYFSSSQSVAALGLNPVLFLMDTAENRGSPYDTKKARDDYAYAASLLGIEKPDPKRLDYARYVKPRVHPQKKYNLVVIHLESLAGYKTGIFGNKLNGTPHLDAIAKNGVLFTHFFVPEVPTARSVFTMITGIPDVNGETHATRDPLLVNQNTLVDALEGYDKFYFIGGSATWGNIRGLFTHNIPDLKMYEEGDYDAPSVDGWGVSDVALFAKANEVFGKEKKPFFAFIQTAGNHRPYKLPEDHPGFELAQVDEATLRENGFDSLAAYNGLRYLDFSLGTFFALAQKSPYFRDTVFVMYGDHGNPSTAQTPWQQLYLTGNHVPMIIYAPELLKEGRRIDFTASLPDTLPTSLGILGVPYVNTGLGRDLFALGPNDPHFSLIGLDGVLDDEFYLHVYPGGDRLFRYRSDAAVQDVHEKYPQKAAELRRLYETLLWTSKYMLYHNAPRVSAPEQQAATP